MIDPFASKTLDARIVADPAKRKALEEEAQNLTSVVVTSAAAANLVMLGGGYFNPLTGTMNLADSISVAENMKTTSGLFWPVPIVNRVDDASGLEVGQRIALRDPNRDGNQTWFKRLFLATQGVIDCKRSRHCYHLRIAKNGCRPGFG